MNYWLIDGRLLLDGTHKMESSLKISDGKIDAIQEKPQEDGHVRISINGALIAPGFIDMHIHGFEELHFTAGGAEALTTASLRLAKHGVTSFYPTVATDSWELMLDAARKISSVKGTEKGATISGVHLEGPFLAAERNGAQEAAHLLIPGKKEKQQVSEQCDDISLLTMAPEIDGVTEMGIHCRNNGIVPLIGHTNAKYDELFTATATGMDHFVHLFNAMRPLNHREPGCVGFALTNRETTCELICDGFHVHPEIIKMVYKLKGAETIAMVSDHVPLGGLNVKEEAGEKRRVAFDGRVYRLPDGTIAGSACNMERGVKNFVSWGIPIEDALVSASRTPAKVLGIGNRKGEVKIGYDADLVILDDAGNVKMTIVNGSIVYQNT